MSAAQKPVATQMLMFEVVMTPAEKKIRNQLDGLFGRHKELTDRIKVLEATVEELKNYLSDK